jgi:apolipoprotein D and lipocalin family protein
MKSICALLLITLSSFSGITNKPVEKVDIKRFGGTWYSLYSLPTMFDKGSRETTTHYTLNKDGYYDVVTTYKNGDKPEVHSIKSKLFQVEGTNNSEMKAQFIWPIKLDYWVIELPDDYSYAVIGHPDHRFLFILSRKPEMDKKLYEQILARCKAMGYAVDQLVCQQHRPSAMIASASK